MKRRTFLKGLLGTAAVAPALSASTGKIPKTEVVPFVQHEFATLGWKAWHSGLVFSGESRLLHVEPINNSISNGDTITINDITLELTDGR